MVVDVFRVMLFARSISCTGLTACIGEKRKDAAWHPDNFCSKTLLSPKPHTLSCRSCLSGHDGRGDSPAWRLELLIVVDMGLGTTAYFPCSAWIDAGNQGHASCRLQASYELHFSPSSLVRNEFFGQNSNVCCAEGEGASQAATNTVGMRIVRH